jgi:hypothetical protein
MSEDDESKQSEYKDSPLSEDGKGSSSVVPHSPARGDYIMSTSEALLRLTQEENLVEEESEWLIVKVPKAPKSKLFLVDYVDGDTEDEFRWLEGLLSQAHISIADLLERRRGQSRKDRRRQGHTEFRDDEELDRKDPH